MHAGGGWVAGGVVVKAAISVFKLLLYASYFYVSLHSVQVGSLPDQVWSA